MNLETILRNAGYEVGINPGWVSNPSEGTIFMHIFTPRSDLESPIQPELRIKLGTCEEAVLHIKHKVLFRREI